MKSARLRHACGIGGGGDMSEVSEGDMSTLWADFVAYGAGAGD